MRPTRIRQASSATLSDDATIRDGQAQGSGLPGLPALDAAAAPAPARPGTGDPFREIPSSIDNAPIRAESIGISTGVQAPEPPAPLPPPAKGESP